MKPPTPRFYLFQPVLLHIDGQIISTSIEKRLFDVDKEQWLYEVHISLSLTKLVTSSNLEARIV